MCQPLRTGFLRRRHCTELTFRLIPVVIYCVVEEQGTLPMITRPPNIKGG